MKEIETLNSASQRGPSRQDLLEHNMKRARGLGLRFESGAFNSRHPSMLLKIKENSERFSSSTQLGSASAKRINHRELATLSDAQKREYAAQTLGRDVAIVSVKRMRDVLNVIAALLNIQSEAPRSR